MKILSINHNSVPYEFRYLERTNVIEVWKDDRFTYLISSTPRTIKCNCPGGTFRGRCWHVSMIPELLSQPTTHSIFADIVEEVGEMVYKKGKIRRN